jgi:ketosteroid isomerase-like protein
MLPCRSTSVLLPVLAFAVTIPVRASENTKEVLRRQTQELVDAITAGSAAVWDRYLDAGLLYVDEGGKLLTKKQMVEQTKPLPEGVSGSIRVIDFDVAVHGDVAVATYVDDEYEDFHGHKLHCQYRTTDTWKKTPEGWRLIAGQVLALRADPPAIALAAPLRREYCGRYALTPAISYEIRCNGDALQGQQTGRKTEELRAEAPDVLFVPGQPRYRYVFLRGADGQITGFAQRREAWDLVWKRQPK